ncbi:MAG TPA: helix-turn-helix domain-containing protein [Chloroflexota bacterium]|nr:helix-turn-helix domain-containing protein [Chloroflexota bacterium]
MAEGDSTDPAARLEIHDLAALRIMADPLRARLVRILRQSAATAKEAAAVLGTSPKSLYYHLGLLERHGLIRVVETRLVSGITEKRYRATAYLFLYGDLEPGEGETPLQGLEIVAGSYIAITAEEVRESIREGRLLPKDPGVPCDRTLQLGWYLPRLRPEEAISLGQRLHDLLHEYESLGEGAQNAGCDTYRVLYALFPTHPRRDLSEP